MRSFLKEIESKFQELQEKELDRDGDGDVDTDDYLMAKDQAIKKAMAKQKSNEATFEVPPDKLAQVKAQAGDDDTIKVVDEELDEAHCNTKQEDVDEAHCNTKQEDVDEDIDEISQSSGVASYPTPNAFKDPDAPEKKYTYASVSEAMDQKYVQMIESYSRFATGNAKATPTQTVNGTIKEVAKKLQEIEKLVRYTSRLKNESGIAGSTYGKSTKNALGKISERLLKISERIRSLGE